MQTTNYARVYEFSINNQNKKKKKKLKETDILRNIFRSCRGGVSYPTLNGTFYVKQYKICENSIVFLFGKDNEDASNYKREKKSAKLVKKINIDETTEILTDFIHIAVSKTERLGGYTVLIEKNRLFHRLNIIHLLHSCLNGRLVDFEFGRRVISDFYKEIQQSKRILNIRQIEREPNDPNLPKDTEFEKQSKSFYIERQLEIRALPYQSIPRKIADLAIPVFRKKEGTKTIVTIVNKYNSKINLDFDDSEAEIGITIPLPENSKISRLQKAIVDKLDLAIGLDNQGKL